MNTDLFAAAPAATARAVELLRSGEPVALPTETVYGLAADATNPAAVAKIFEAKERPFFDPLIVHLPDIDWLPRVAREVPDLAQKLITAFWPGPLTIVLPRTALVPDLVTSGLDTVALRMSAHPVFHEICAAFGGPLAAPSANRFGRISPTCAEDVRKELGGRIPLVVDGGPTVHGVESTIVTVHENEIRVLRDGPVTREQLAEFGPVVSGKTGVKPDAPGQLESHYAPRTKMRIADGKWQMANPDAAKRIGLLAWQSVTDPARFAHIEHLSISQDLREAAAKLFAAMRRLDEAGLELILAEPVPEHGLGVAIMDRLRKAAAHG
jgi:L-threonylcarbamoyladenylate synthase